MAWAVIAEIGDRPRQQSILSLIATFETERIGRVEQAFEIVPPDGDPVGGQRYTDGRRC